MLLRKLRRRAVAEPGYGRAVGERFGRYARPIDSLMPPSSTDPLHSFVWIHAVSLGETRAAAILLAELRQQLPGMRLLLTHGTATGRAEGAKLLLPGDVQVWQPWDTPGPVRRFLRQFRPAIGILMETEVWPNLVAGCQQQGIPLVLANARLNAASLRKSLDAFARLDTQTALEVIKNDNEIDAEFDGLMRKLITYMMEDPRTISSSIDLIFVAKAIERVGDHAKNLAEAIIYIVKGTDVRHTSMEDVENVVR